MIRVVSISRILFTKYLNSFASKKIDEKSLYALSPLDGRYSSQSEPLKEYFSEAALMKYRVKVEIEWLKFLEKKKMIKENENKHFEFSSSDQEFLESIYRNFKPEDAKRIKEIENITNHDVKAVEYFIKEKLALNEKLRLDFIKEYVHFCCTSEDINNLAYSLILTDCKNGCLKDYHLKLSEKLQDFAITHKSDAMLSRTHGQSASPTTVGKEIANFAYRLNTQTKLMENIKFSAKINGAVGNFNAHYFVYPEYNWLKLSQEFIETLGLEFNPYTTQIEPHDSIAVFYSYLNIYNTILIGMSRDIWHYISLGYFTQKTNDKEIGSSTMPHKVNPIDFENAEGNLGLANSMATHFISKLPISRFQRDLSDSTVMRNHGLALGYSILAYSSLLKGFNKLGVNKNKLDEELDNHWEILAEPIQMIMRKFNIAGGYEKMKDITRGKGVNREIIKKFIDDEIKSIPKNELEKLRNLKPGNYIGNAEKMADITNFTKKN